MRINVCLSIVTMDTDKVVVDCFPTCHTLSTMKFSSVARLYTCLLGLRPCLCEQACKFPASAQQMMRCYRGRLEPRFSMPNFVRCNGSLALCHRSSSQSPYGYSPLPFSDPNQTLTAQQPVSVSVQHHNVPILVPRLSVLLLASREADVEAVSSAGVSTSVSVLLRSAVVSVSSKIATWKICLDSTPPNW
jgi:hypothetical protein